MKLQSSEHRRGTTECMKKGDNRDSTILAPEPLTDKTQEH